MKCPNPECNTENFNKAKFCRKCGTPLEESPLPDPKKNVMDQYPLYHFRPTNLMKWKKPWAAVCISRFFGLVAFCAGLWIGYLVYSMFDFNVHQSYDHWEWDSYDKRYYLEEGECRISDILGYTWNHHSDYDTALSEYREDIRAYIFVTLIPFTIASLLYYFNRSQLPNSKTTPLNSAADYIQAYSYSGLFRRRKTPKLVFFVKDRLWGVMDVAHYKPFLPAEYDYLSWREKDKYLIARQGGKKMIIDIYGKELH